MTSFLKKQQLWKYITGEIIQPTKKNNEINDKFKDQLEERTVKSIKSSHGFASHPFHLFIFKWEGL